MRNKYENSRSVALFSFSHTEKLKKKFLLGQPNLSVKLLEPRIGCRHSLSFYLVWVDP